METLGRPELYRPSLSGRRMVCPPQSGLGFLCRRLWHFLGSERFGMGGRAQYFPEEPMNTTVDKPEQYRQGSAAVSGPLSRITVLNKLCSLSGSGSGSDLYAGGNFTQDQWTGLWTNLKLYRQVQCGVLVRSPLTMVLK